MKTKLTLQQETYPLLMIREDTDKLVLFFKRSEGVLIQDYNHNIGTEDTIISMHSSSWNMDLFSKVQGKHIIFFQPRDEYPKYRKCRSSEMIVLFHDEDEGIVIHPNKKHHVGFYSRTWFQRDFEDAAGELIISN